ncbi:MAG: SDR family oxidoreductase [Spirochaetia bacterium]|nr:SDR family oxidoreductase [Spirochaetia bacterium]
MGKAFKERYPGHALITGASGGIGEAFARKLAKLGVNLVLVARRKSRLDEIAAELTQAYGIQVHTIGLDLLARDAHSKIKSELDTKKIQIGMLVNNVGFGTFGRFHELSVEKELEMIDLNCRLPVALTAMVLPEMIQRKNGALIFLGSVGSYQPTPFFTTYGATKAFDLMFGEGLWAELKPHGVDVIVLTPGFTRTEFQNTAGNREQKAVMGWQTADQVVDICLNKLGKTLSVVPGIGNFLLIWFIRFTPRFLAAKLAYKISDLNHRKCKRLDGSFSDIDKGKWPQRPN